MVQEFRISNLRWGLGKTGMHDISIAPATGLKGNVP
jgi:hypothetical protein